jgi:hypothetical protein
LFKFALFGNARVQKKRITAMYIEVAQASIETGSAARLTTMIPQNIAIRNLFGASLAHLPRGSKEHCKRFSASRFVCEQGCSKRCHQERELRKGHWLLGLAV